MKHLLALLLLCCLALPSAAQRRKAPLAPPLTVPTVFCVLIVVDPGHSQQLVLDYGQHPPTNVQDAELEALAIAVAPMVSSAAALNYLYSKGWEPVQSAAFPYSESAYRDVKSQLHYVLRRRTP